MTVWLSEPFRTPAAGRRRRAPSFAALPAAAAGPYRSASAQSPAASPSAQRAVRAPPAPVLAYEPLPHAPRFPAEPQRDERPIQFGLGAGGQARLCKITTAEMGQIFKISMSCTELPTASSNVGLDIDLRSGANLTRAYDFDLSAGTSLIAAGGNWALGKTIEQLVTVPTANHALYLTTGGAHTGDSVYTAGQLVITLHGHKLLTA